MAKKRGTRANYITYGRRGMKAIVDGILPFLVTSNLYYCNAEIIF